MRPDHRRVFWEVARGVLLDGQTLPCWIGVREPNPLADRWIGLPGYAPKSLKCKAKTADNDRFAYAGLVTDPHARPEAFLDRTRSEAIATWGKFAPGGHLPAGFTCDADGETRGLVRQQSNQCLIFADYDLMSVVVSNAQGEFLETSDDLEERLGAEVERRVNAALGVPMVQHGPEFAYREGVGARERENVLWFGPGRRMQVWPSSMPRAGH
jgi:hypothetical protein